MIELLGLIDCIRPKHRHSHLGQVTTTSVSHEQKTEVRNCYHRRVGIINIVQC